MTELNFTRCGPGGSCGKAPVYGLEGPGSVPDRGGVRILKIRSSHRVQTDHEVHSTSFIMSTGTFLEVKSAGA